MSPKDYRVRVVVVQIWDPADDNVDVEVTLADGVRFGATFFTVKNVETLFRKNRETGECGGGIYLWATNMILVEELTMEVLEKAVQDLMDSEEFYSAFCRFSER